MKKPPVLSWKEENAKHCRLWTAPSRGGGIMFVVHAKEGWQWGWHDKKSKAFPAASKKEAFQEAHEHELKIETLMIENIAKLAFRYGEDFFGKAFST